MAVIREDVVSIGFEVARNPFAELTAGINDIKIKLGIFDDAGRGLREVGEEARTAGRDLESLSNSIHAPPDADGLVRPLRETQEQAERVEETFTDMVKSMAKVGKTKLDAGVKKLTAGIKKPVSGIQNLAKGAKEASSYLKRVGLPHALNAGLGKAATGAKKLAGDLKAAAGIGFNKAIGGLKSLASEAGKATGKLGKGLLKGAGRLAIGVTAGITAASGALGAGAVAAYKFGSAYETSLAKVSTMVDTSVISMKDLSGQVLDLSNATGEDAAGLNEAVYQALSAGADSAGVVDLVGTAVKAAKGGFTDAETAVDGLTSTLNAYGMATSDAEGLANQFLITQNKGKTTFGELASNIGGVAPTAQAAGVGVDELLSGVASLTANGIGTSEAMTGIKSALSNIIKPSSEAAKKAKELGLNFSTAELQSKGLAGFLDEVKTATGGNTDTMAQLFGSVEALNTVLTLTSDQGSQLMNDTLAEMATNTTALDDAYNTMSATAENSVKKGLNSFKNLGIGIYQANEGPVSELTGLFSKAGDDLYKAFQKGGFEGLVGQIGDTLADTLTTITGYLPDFIEGGVSIVESLLDGILDNEDQITDSLIKGIISLQKGIIRIVPKLVVAGARIITSLVQGLAESYPELMTSAADGIKVLVQGLKDCAPRLLQSAVTIVNSLVNGLSQALPQLIPAGVEMIGELLNGLVSNLDVLVSGAATLVFALVQGIINSIPVLISTAVNLVQGLVQGISNNAGSLVDGAIDLIQGLLTGLISNLPAIIEGAVQIVVALAGGLIQAIPQLIAAIPKLIGAIIDTIMDTDWLQLGKDIVKGIGRGITNGIKGIFGKNKDNGKETMQSLAEGMDEGSPLAKASAELTSKDITTKVDNTNLYGSGKNIMSGLNNGMLSMQGTLNTTASNIGSGISTNLNSSLDIHSPSRVTEETGEYTDLGLVKGMEGMSGRVEKTARSVGDTTAKNITPYKSQYSPATGQSAGSANSTSQVNNWNPVFNLTLNGASASDSNERKVKRWVKETIKESMEGMGRTNPRLQEV